jgi:hypothetical protein
MTLLVVGPSFLSQRCQSYFAVLQDAVEALASTNGTLEVFKYSYDG